MKRGNENGLDAVGWSILGALQENARISFAAEVEKNFLLQDQEYLAKNDPQLQEWWNKVFKSGV